MYSVLLRTASRCSGASFSRPDAIEGSANLEKEIGKNMKESQQFFRQVQSPRPGRGHGVPRRMRLEVPLRGHPSRLWLGPLRLPACTGENACALRNAALAHAQTAHAASPQ
eukprot:7387915-Prymnesium_polylepis.1